MDEEPDGKKYDSALSLCLDSLVGSHKVDSSVHSCTFLIQCYAAVYIYSCKRDVKSYSTTAFLPATEAFYDNPKTLPTDLLKFHFLPLHHFCQ